MDPKGVTVPRESCSNNTLCWLTNCTQTPIFLSPLLSTSPLLLSNPNCTPVPPIVGSASHIGAAIGVASLPDPVERGVSTLCCGGKAIFAVCFKLSTPLSTGSGNERVRGTGNCKASWKCPKRQTEVIPSPFSSFSMEE